jgi:GTPase SAR1 family protein
MGLCASLPEADKQARARNRQIERDLRENRKNEETVTKLLLLGAGQSGKSTFFKQMKQLYTQSSWTDSELASKKMDIYRNIITSMRTLITETIEPGLSKVEPLVYDGEVKDYVDTLKTMTGTFPIDAEMGQMMKAVWAHPSTQATFARSADFQLNDNTKYYLDKIETISKGDYTPSLQDVLYVRIRTSGIVEAHFKIDDQPFRMFDVGGQRNERKKWIHCFEDVTAVLYVCSLSGYDQVCYEDSNQNRLVESLDLFERTRGSKWFKDTPFILFLNKDDLFKEKIKKVDLRNTDKQWFLQYNGGCSYDAAKLFIQHKFEEKLKDQQLYSHFTTAVDSGNVRHVFNSCKSIFLNQNLQDAGFME